MPATLTDTITSDAMPDILEYSVVLDGTNDVTVHTPAAGKRVWVIGAQFSDDATPDLTFKSAASKTLTLELAANQGNFEKIALNGFYFVTKPGEALILGSTAAYSQVTLYVVEEKQYNPIGVAGGIR